MRFLVDAQLPPALARWIGAHGHEASHVSDRGMESSNDEAIWDRAFETDAVILTKDEDFAQRRSRENEGPSVVWVRIGNTRSRELLAWFEPLFPSVVASLEQGEKLIEIR